MLVSELPVTAVPHPDLPNVWDDPGARTRYYLDPTDPLLLVSRGWTDAEVAAANDAVATRVLNADLISKQLRTLRRDLAAEIGSKPGSAEYAPGLTSLRGILHPESTANAAVKALARYQLTAHRALLGLVKLQLADLDSNALGGE